MNNDFQEGSHWEKVMVTHGVKHSVPLEEILSIEEILNFGLTKKQVPPKDNRKLLTANDSSFLASEGLPAIDIPKFISVDDSDDFLEDEDLGISLCMPGEDGKPMSKIQCFWFAWLNCYPNTELFIPNQKRKK